MLKLMGKKYLQFYAEIFFLPKPVSEAQTRDPLIPSTTEPPGIFFGVLRGEIRPLSQWDLGDFFPNLKKNPQSKKKKKKIFFFFFF